MSYYLPQYKLISHSPRKHEDVKKVDFSLSLIQLKICKNPKILVKSN